MEKICLLWTIFFCTSLTILAADMDSSVAKFSVDFLNQLPKSQSVVSSPLSCEIVLALLALGSEDPSHSELLKALSLTDSNLKKSFQGIAGAFQTVKGVTLNVANKIYVKQGGYNVHPELTKDAIEIFKAEIEKVDFGQNVETVALINSWVENKTNKKIKDLLTADSVNSDTRLVLINAIHFKGLWKNKFLEENTRDREFHVNPSRKVKIPMMAQENTFRYGVSEKLKAQLLDMPYEGGEASMLIILPDAIEGLQDVMDKLLGGHDLMQEYKKLKSRKVNAVIPKFKIETEIDLVPVLKALGVISIFDQSKQNGLTKLLDNDENLFVSKAIQKAFIEVNEEGTEAAAATGMVLMMRCMPMPPPEFVADRPFVYALVGPENTTLFVGTFAGNGN